MIDFAKRTSGFFVMPDGSKREWLNLSTSVCSGTPYCRDDRNDKGPFIHASPVYGTPSYATAAPHTADVEPELRNHVHRHDLWRRCHQRLRSAPVRLAVLHKPAAKAAAGRGPGCELLQDLVRQLNR